MERRKRYEADKRKGKRFERYHEDKTEEIFDMFTPEILTVVGILLFGMLAYVCLKDNKKQKG